MVLLRKLLTTSLVAVVLSLTEKFVLAQNTPPVQRMMAQAYYLREPTDRAWNIRLIGEVPSLAGMYIIVHDSKGKLLYRGAIGHGKYSQEHPLVIPFPLDGVTGDYRVHLVGQQDDYLGLRLPLSDLPFEVYSGTWLSVGNDKNLLAFKPPADATELAMAAYGGHLHILGTEKNELTSTRNGGKVVTPGDKNSKFFSTQEKYVEFPVEAQHIYWLRADTMYFKTREKIFFAFDPQKLFEPAAAELDAVPYWELASRRRADTK